MTTTRDGFLGGRLTIRQPAKGYRAATDPVFLAAACPARPGEAVLELGCGVGVASLCLAARVADLTLTAVERQADYAALARENAADAGAWMQVAVADLTDLPSDLKAQGFDQVIANPPFYAADAGPPAGDAGREAALREDTPLIQWVATARARLKPKGWLTLIQAADRLPDCLAAMEGFGTISVLPLQPRPGRDASRVLIRARKGGRTPFRLSAPLLVHESANHPGDRPDYTETARAILRDGAALPWT